MFPAYYRSCLPSDKITVRSRKSAFFSGFTHLPTPIWQGLYFIFPGILLLYLFWSRKPVPSNPKARVHPDWRLYHQKANHLQLPSGEQKPGIGLVGNSGSNTWRYVNVPCFGSMIGKLYDQGWIFLHANHGKTMENSLNFRKGHPFGRSRLDHAGVLPKFGLPQCWNLLRINRKRPWFRGPIFLGHLHIIIVSCS